MNLRTRLIAALLALVTVGLTGFGVTMYALYSRSQSDRLDQQLRGSVALVEEQLEELAGVDGPGPHGGPASGDHGAPQVYAAPGTYGELRDGSGTVLAKLELSSSASPPKLPDPLPAAGSVFTVSSRSGAGEWRILVTRAEAADHATYTVVEAMPTTEVTGALHRLVLIEVGTAAGLLLLLGAGSWLILRRGLRPLEAMASSARSISAGALDQRVTVGEAHGEVAQLGTAINSMLADLERAFREREATEQRLRQFLADASHELRTPLTSIRGFAELFRLGSEDIDLPIIMRRIEEESARMRDLVEDLLTLARLDQTRDGARTRVDLSVIAADACTDAAVVAPDRRITLQAAAPVIIDGDEAHLRPAIGNLLTNAVRHTPPGTAIEVTTAASGGQATVEVRDHGRGLEDDALAHAFDRFWQGDRARTTQGAGLGLAIVAAIAGEHGGAARAANAPGGGAVFTLTFPRAAAVVTAAPEPEESDPEPAPVPA